MAGAEDGKEGGANQGPDKRGPKVGGPERQVFTGASMEYPTRARGPVRWAFRIPIIQLNLLYSLCPRRLCSALSVAY